MKLLFTLLITTNLFAAKTIGIRMLRVIPDDSGAVVGKIMAITQIGSTDDSELKKMVQIEVPLTDDLKKAANVLINASLDNGKAAQGVAIDSKPVVVNAAPNKVNVNKVVPVKK